jgi:hypothetical protein
MTRDSAPATTALIVIGRPAALKVAFPVLTADLREALEAIPRPRLSP